MWGGQGVVAGEYYKEEIGKGKYKLEGDLFNVPEAPEWLLSRMKDQYKKKHQDVDVKYVDNRWSKRTKEERIAIVSGCLSVIKYTGPNSERYWWEIGAMINNELQVKRVLTYGESGVSVILIMNIVGIAIQTHVLLDGMQLGEIMGHIQYVSFV